MTDPPTVSLPEKFPLSAFGLLLVLTCAAIAVHGYHLGIEDEAIYLPAIKKLLDPQLYPYDAEFFLGQARGSALPLLVAYSVRATHVPLNWAVFGWQFASLYLMLLACFCVVRRCFAALRDQWGALTLVTALLTLPVAGTGLYLADQHLHPRTLATAAILYSLSAALDRRIVATAASAAAAFALHPLMAIFGISLVALIFLPMERWSSWARPSFAMPFLSRPTAAWREAVATREYYFLRNWQWYEWLGIFAPVVILWWFLGMAKRFHSPKFLLLAHRVVLFSILWFVAGMTITVPRALEFLVPVQPMRYLHLVYLLMILFAGGFLAHFVLRGRLWRWVLLLLPICVGMFLAQRDLFSASSHVGWPLARHQNKWVAAFLWIRSNTPRDVYFALDPRYMSLPGEENYGFRALAERSQIADYSKDAAVVSVAPALAQAWQQQVHALDGFQSFTPADFRRLNQQFRVNMILLDQSKADSLATAGFDCPYRNELLAVCRVPPQH